jgi:peptide/nickel transport system substrate-binding protein
MVRFDNPTTRIPNTFEGGPATGGRMTKTTTLALAAALCAGLSSQTLAQKHGGTLRMQHRDNAPSASIHEEATNSVVEPFMAVYNNLIMFDSKKPVNSADSIVADLATTWSWDGSKTKLTFKLRDGVKWHDGKPFSSADVKCTFDMLTGKAKKGLRKNPRSVWYFNLKDVTTNGPTEVTLVLGKPQPSFLNLLASGYTPMYPCHVDGQKMRTAPIGTGPFKFVSWKRNETIRLVKNPDYFKKGLPYLDAIEWRIIPSVATRALAFSAGDQDMTFPSDTTIRIMADIKAKKPDAICDLHPTGVSSNLIVNSSKPPFDNPKIRRAMDMALDRDAFITILSEGKYDKTAAMLPKPEGQWGFTKEQLAKIPGYGSGAEVEKSRAAARKIMEDLGYSAAKPLQIKISTRNIAVYRDPAVILIDQLKSIHISGELEVVDSSVWHAKATRGDYVVGLNLTGVGVDDPDVNLVENYTCKSERNYTKYCNPEVDRLIFTQSSETDIAKRKAMVDEIQMKLIEDVARPMVYYQRLATCWQPYVKGYVPHRNSIYNRSRYEDVWLDK